jgi:predicted SnoaL-like aldol condensation-catalyzing enzyme
MTNKQVALEFLLFASRGEIAAAYDRHVAPSFKHHNPFFAAGADALRAAMTEAAMLRPEKTLDLKLAIEEGDRVAVLSHVKQHPGDRGGAVVHIFRLEGRKIVELWDVGQLIPEVSPNTDGVF